MARLQLTSGGLLVAVSCPDELVPQLGEVLAGPPVAPSAEAADSCYTITAEGPGRFGLERDGGGLRRDADPVAVVGALVDDLVHLTARRRPEHVVVEGGVAAVDGRGILVLGAAEAGRSELLSALVAAGGELWSDGFAVLDPQGRACPLTVAAGDPPLEETRESLAPVPVVMIVATGDEPGAQWPPTEVTGARAVLRLLGHVWHPGGSSPAARALGRALAENVVELRVPSPDATTGAVHLVDRARRMDLPAPVGPDEPTGADGTGSTARPVSPPVVCFEDFLDAETHERLLDLAASRAADFASSGVHAADPAGGDQHPQIRRSRSLYDLGPVWEPIRAKIVELLPHVRRELGVDWFPLGEMEHHLTGHGEGDHFTLHVDNSTPDTSLREISAVYYFNRQPRRFTGGALRLFDTVERDGVVEAVGSHTDIDPRDNRVVFFRSDTHHEVRPVHVDSDDFADQRFTLVFWARRVPPVQAVFQGDPDTVTARQHELIPSLTADGFRVVATPPEVQERLVRRFEEGRSGAVTEVPDATFLPTGTPSLVAVGDEGATLLADLQGLHEEWSGRRLVPSAAYGIRVYGAGQTLRPHCDRVETHVISSVVHVAADVDEPWALSITDAAGRAHDVFLEPGETLLYESAKLPHGRPRPLRGRHYASVFLHYRPVDWDRTLAEVCRSVGYGVPVA